MATTTGSTILWSDIVTVLNKVNAARQNVGKGTITLAGGVGATALATVPSNLYAGLTALNNIKLPQYATNSSNQKYVTSFVTVSVTSITLPRAGDYLKWTPMGSIATEADRIAALCNGFCPGCFAFCPYFTNNFGFSFGDCGFGFFTGNNGFSFSDCGFGFFSGRNGFSFSDCGFGFFSGNNGFSFSDCGFGFFSGNNGFSRSCSCNNFGFGCSSSQVFSVNSNSGFSFGYRKC